MGTTPEDRCQAGVVPGGTRYSPPGEDEHELLRRARAGDHRSFSHLVRAHDSRMRGLAGRLLASRSAMDDALQDAYLKAYRGLGSFDGRSSFSTWLYSITYRTCVDHLRAQGRRHEVALHEASAVVATGQGVADQVATRGALREALLELPSDQAAAVLLIDGEGLSYIEAAEAIGVAPGTIGSRLSRARHTLRARLTTELRPSEPTTTSIDQEGGLR